MVNIALTPANIGTMLVNHRHTRLDQQRSNIRYYWQANDGPVEFCPAGQYWHCFAQPSPHQHWTNKGPTSDINGWPVSAKQWFYVQCICVSDEENYKPGFLLKFF